MLKPDTDVSIYGINLPALFLATALSYNGVSVCIWAEQEKPDDFPENLVFDNYIGHFLAQFGYQIKNNAELITVPSFLEQSLKLLASRVCPVVWKSSEKEIEKNLLPAIYSQNKAKDDAFIYHAQALLLNNNLDLSFRSILLLGWRISGVLNKTLKQRTLVTEVHEKALLQEQWNLKAYKQPLFKRLLDKIHPPKAKAYQLIDAKINLHLSQDRSLEAGELFPNFNFYDEKAQVEIQLHQWTNYQYFSVILFGYLSQPNLFTVSRWMQLNYPVKLYYLPPSEKNNPLFEFMGIKPDTKRTFIVRPDLYLGLIHDTIDVEVIDNYLKNVLGMKINHEEINSFGA
ncbi:hypothetical protein [Pedobacter glucosidilyticus]|uniref:hypothetical protein n=1 Tax=Pedobacter glucosidilyticus TaxID=1122941 RepID=UPI00041FB374|nr:hypothetical protein [Pedobacter glucosidilyticus]